MAKVNDNKDFREIDRFEIEGRKSKTFMGFLSNRVKRKILSSIGWRPIIVFILAIIIL